MEKQEENSEKEGNKALLPDMPPPPRKVTPPEALIVRPAVKNALDALVPNLNQHEFRYLLQLMKAKASAGVSQSTAQPEPPPSAQPQPTELVHPLPELQQALDDIKMAEHYVTQGYTVQYPPKMVVPLGGQHANEPDLMGVLEHALDRLTENPKVAEGIGNFLNALAKKLEGEA